MGETCTAGKKYGKETVKGGPTRGQDSVRGRAKGALPSYACYPVRRSTDRSSSRAHGRDQLQGVKDITRACSMEEWRERGLYFFYIAYISSNSALMKILLCT